MIDQESESLNLTEILNKIISQNNSLTEQVNGLKQLSSVDNTAETRMPAPRNITEIGGYINLMQKLHDKKLKNIERYTPVKERNNDYYAALQEENEMLKQTLKKILGLTE